MADNNKKRRFDCGCIRDMDDVGFYRNNIPVCPEHGTDGRVIGYQITCIDCHKVFNVGIRGSRRLRCRPCHYRKYPQHRPKARRQKQAPRFEPLPFEEEYIHTHPWLAAWEISDVLGWGRERAEYWCSMIPRAEPWVADRGERVLQEYFACRVIPELSEQFGYQVGAINAHQAR